MNTETIGFIGAGNMAASLIGGLIQDGCNPARILVSDVDSRRLAALREHGVEGVDDNNEVVARADIVVLAVKPQVMKGVCQALAPVAQQARPLILSVAAGLRLADLDRWLGGGLAVVRAMPNTPALVQTSATALYANHRVDEVQRQLAESVMRAVGLTLWLDDEAQMDAVTALSGSGPAYFFLLMEVLQDAGEQLGLAPETARLLTLQTALGAAKLALESNEDAAELRRRVTSPGGTTERALAVLQQAGLDEVFARALRAGAERAEELAQQLGAD